MKHHVAIILLLQLFAVYDAARLPLTEDAGKTCGYSSCPKVDPSKLNIHLVPHTHDDVGWLKTVDQYFFGSRNNIQKAGVQYIIDTVVESLLQDPSRRFIYVETAFLWKWWQRQNEETRQNVRNLINEGRLEIIGGGWSMNDEAVTHYHSIIDQFTWGFRRLNDTFGTCARPKIGWQIDPFGHSREQASIFAQMGFDGMFFGRLDYQDKSKRLAEKSAEFVWRGSPSLGQKADLFSGVLFNNYGPPPGFCFDILCQDEPMIDDPEGPENNIDAKLKSFLHYVDSQATHYRTNHVILTMGGDFTYQLAQMYFQNMDKLIRYVNERNGTNYNAFYSTPSCYLKALNDQKKSWPVKTDDFFPYASDPHAYWTGYFSSRPTLKYYERMGNNFLQITKQLSVLSGLPQNPNLDHFREAMGVMQHHDAVTGTEKQLVANDYARLLSESMSRAATLVSDSMSKIVKKDSKSEAVQFHSCTQFNISSCLLTEVNKNFVITVYNPLSQPLTTYVRIPITGSSYTVSDYTETKLITQIVPVAEPVVDVPGRKSSASRELVFEASDVPALGYASYYVTEDAREDVLIEPSTDATLRTEKCEVSVDPTGNIVVKVSDAPKPDTVVVQSFHYYQGAEGNNEIFVNRSSGAYIFRPKTSDFFNFTKQGSFKVYKGALVQEIHQTVNDWMSQVIRLYRRESRIEFEWLVGPIPVNDKIGKEIVSKYSSNLETNGVFYTDSNGREMLERKTNYRPTWNVNIQEPIAGNYYPVTSKISIKDGNKRVSVMTDRAQGGSSLRSGEVELMLHRRLLRDDAFGVGEALNESAFGEGLVVRGVHHLQAGDPTDLNKFVLEEKNIALKLALRPWILVSPTKNIPFDLWRNTYLMKGEGLAKKLPPNVHILTLEPWKDDTVLLRLEHLFEAGEAPQYSQPVEINIKDLFAPFTVVAVRETTLGGNQWIEDLERLKWEMETNDILLNDNPTVPPVVVEDDNVNVLMNPMDIRTFIIKVSR